MIELTEFSGYKSSPFPLKASQQTQVTKILSETGFMPPELVTGEVDWFYGHLGLSNEFL
jgi:glutamate dehydrogenase